MLRDRMKQVQVKGLRQTGFRARSRFRLAAGKERVDGGARFEEIGIWAERSAGFDDAYKRHVSGR